MEVPLKWQRKYRLTSSCRFLPARQHPLRLSVPLGQHGVNIPGFCKEFNDRTAKENGMIIPVVITVYTDRTFSFITKTPPAPVLIKKELNLQKASGRPNKDKVGRLTKEQVKRIAEIKMPDLNAGSIEAAMSMVAGTARSMGVTVEE